MPRLLLIIFCIFVVLVMINFTFTSLGSLFSSQTPISLLVGPRALQGLSSIDLNIFTPGGDGLSYVTQGYGHTIYSGHYVAGFHNGIDIAARYGADVHSPDGGTVIATGDQDRFCYHRGFGKYVAVSDPAHGYVLWYAHLGTIAVSPGTVVKKDTVLGTIGLTGLETGPHLHFSVFKLTGFTMKVKNGCGPDADGVTIDPLSYLRSVD